MPPPPGTADRRHVAVEDEVNKQYDTDASMAFYEHVMGGGGDDIHYGLFLAPGDGLRQSSQNSVEMLASMAEACGALAKVSVAPSNCTQNQNTLAFARAPDACAGQDVQILQTVARKRTDSN